MASTPMHVFGHDLGMTDPTAYDPGYGPGANPSAYRHVNPGDGTDRGKRAAGDRREPQRDQRRHPRLARGVGRRRGQPGRRDRRGARVPASGVRRQPERDGVPGQRGDPALADRPSRGAEAAARGAHGAVDDEGEERLCVFAEVDGRAERSRCSARISAGRGSRCDPPGAGRRHLPLPCETAPASSACCAATNAEPQSDEIRMLTGRAAPPVPKVVRSGMRGGRRCDEPGYTCGRTTTCSRVEPRPRTPHRPHHGRGGRSSAALATCSAQLAGDVPIDGMRGSDHLAVVASFATERY
jgi:hypothetical protein